MLKLQEIKIRPDTKVKPRLLLEEFIASDMEIAVIKFKLKGRARHVGQILRDWVYVHEKVKIYQRGYNLYLEKESGEDNEE